MKRDLATVSFAGLLRAPLPPEPLTTVPLSDAALLPARAPPAHTTRQEMHSGIAFEAMLVCTPRSVCKSGTV